MSDWDLGDDDEPIIYNEALIDSGSAYTWAPLTITWNSTTPAPPLKFTAGTFCEVFVVIMRKGDRWRFAGVTDKGDESTDIAFYKEDDESAAYVYTRDGMPDGGFLSIVKEWEDDGYELVDNVVVKDQLLPEEKPLWVDWVESVFLSATKTTE